MNELTPKLEFEDDKGCVISSVSPDKLLTELEPIETKAISTPQKVEGAIQEQRRALATAYMFASNIHSHIKDNITLADQKAVFVFVAITGLLAYLHTKGVAHHWMKNPQLWHINDILACIATLGLTLGAGCALLVITPRLIGSTKGIAFWKAIANFKDSKEYATRVLQSDELALTQALIEDCHELAKICRSKYWYVNLAIICGSLGLVLATVYLAIFH